MTIKLCPKRKVDHDIPAYKSACKKCKNCLRDNPLIPLGEEEEKKEFIKKLKKDARKNPLIPDDLWEENE